MGGWPVIRNEQFSGSDEQHRGYLVLDTHFDGATAFVGVRIRNRGNSVRASHGSLESLGAFGNLTALNQKFRQIESGLGISHQARPRSRDLTRAHAGSDTLRILGKPKHPGQSTEGRADRDWLAEMPEVRKVLDGTLERRSGGSETVHAVFGEELGRLTGLDKKWVAQRVGDIFPDEDRVVCDAAWNAYLFNWYPCDQLFQLLRSEYRNAIRRLGESQSKMQSGQNSAERLAGHLMWLYWWGKLSLDDELVREFFDGASDKIRGHALHFLGYSVYSNKEGPAPETINRLRALFDERLKVAKSSTDRYKYRPELAAFGWWFAADKFDLNWSIATLLDVLKTVGHVEVEHLVVERLAQLSKQWPEECAMCLSLLAEGLDDVLGVYGWETHGSTVLADAITGGNLNAKATAVALINRLESRGYSGFRDLLKGA